MSKILSIALLLLSVMSWAQVKTIKGTITDTQTNQTIALADVNIYQLDINTTTDENGYFEIEVESDEEVELTVLAFGYQEISEIINLSQKDSFEFNFNLSPEDDSSIELGETVIRSTGGNKETEANLLLEQQRSVEIKQNIGAQELSRKGVGDVASAVAKTSGVSKQEGSNNVYVRGLGDRYNSTSINGLPAPSNDPEKKNIDLEIFSTDIVEYISIDKVYMSRISGDFAGGNVDISSKKYKGKGMFELSFGSLINTNAVEKAGGNFLLQDGPGKLGFSSYGIPPDPLNSYSFQNSLIPVSESPFAGNLGFKAGNSYAIGKEGRLNLFATASFGNGFEYREGINQSVSAQNARLKSFHQEKYSYKTNTTGMFNANYNINYNHNLSYNFLFVNSSDQSRDSYYGFIRDLAEEDNGLIQRGTYVQNTLFLNQLLGTHKLSKKIDLDWGTSFSRIESDMPDRTQNTLKYLDAVNGYTFGQNTITDNHRYYQNLVEDELAVNVALSYKLKQDENGVARGKITAGYNGRFKERNLEAIQFNFRISGAQVNTTVIDPNNIDAYLNQQNYSAGGYFMIESFAGMRPQTYTGDQEIHAGFANLEYKLSDRLSAILGLRFEKIEQNVAWVTQLDASGGNNTIERDEFLPSLILKYELNEKQNLRFAASRTYTLPQFKERALFIYEDVTEIKVGNPDLYPSQNYNADLKWELFPQYEEVISLTAFGKYIVDPINEITLASSTNDISFLNTGDWGYVYGVEAEVRKNLFNFKGEYTNKLSVGLNVAYMRTHQELDSEKVKEETNYNINLTDETSGFTGASDLLINADLSYTKNWKNDKSIMATLVYTYFSDRLYALSVETKGNLVDKGVGTVDFILKSKINSTIGINLIAKNILNPVYDRVQANADGDILVMSYKKGAFLGLGLSCQF